MYKELFQIKERKNRYRIICEDKDASFIKLNIQLLGYKIIYQYTKTTQGLNHKVNWVNFIIDAPHAINGRAIDKLQKLCNYKLAAFETYFKDFD